MAIRLASAIGQQREPISILGGVDEAINKTGDAIQADLDRKAEAAAKKKDQEQKYKDIVSSNLQTRSLTDVRTEDWEEDQKFQKEGIARILAASADPNTTKSQLDKELRVFDEELKKREFLYKRDYAAVSTIPEKQKTYDTVLFDNFLIGKTDPTQVSDMPNDDFMAASEMNRAGTMPSENLPSGKGELQNLPNDPNFQGRNIVLPDGSIETIDRGGQNVSAGNKMNEMKRTETQTSYQGVPYFNKSIDERLKTDIDAKVNELTTLKRPNIVKAVQGYEGPDFKFGSLTKATTRISPTTGEIIYDFDEKKADEIGRRFASSMVGKGNFGDKNHEQYQRGLEYEALVAGNDAGYSGERLAAFVQETVPKMAYDDFMKNARSAEMERIKNDREVTKAPSKGVNITFTSGGGGSSKIWNVGDALEAPLYEVKDGKKTDKSIGDYYYHSIQTVAGGENPKKLNIAGYTDVQVEGVNVNKKTGKPEYVDITIPARYDKNDEVVEGTGVKKTVRISSDQEIENLKTNLGKDLYNGTIGAHKPEKGAASSKAAAPKKVTKQEVKNKLAGF
jgi:hypothetical protein